jgi:hypothetical protein
LESKSSFNSSTWAEQADDDSFEPLSAPIVDGLVRDLRGTAAHEAICCDGLHELYSRSDAYF